MPTAHGTHQGQHIGNIDAKGNVAIIQKIYNYPAAAATKNTKAIELPNWHVPPPNDHYFVGREKELAKLKLAFETKSAETAANVACQPVIFSAVSGLGGVGKTQLAIYHCYHPTKTYALTVWFQAETAELLQSDYVKLVEELRLPLLSKTEKPARVDYIRAVHSYLNQHTSWLAVYDNAEEYKKIKDFLPNQGGDVIITTRRPEYHDKGIAIDVDVFNKEDAIAYLKKRLELANKPFSAVETELLKELCEELGHLPLALGQASAYIKKMRTITIADYLKDYRQQNQAMKLLANNHQPLDQKVQPVATTWNISLQAIQQDEQAAKEPHVGISVAILQVMSHLHAEGISYFLLERWLQETNVANDEQIAKKLLRHTISHLVDYSMVQVQADKETVSLHRLVQLVVRNQQKQKISSHPQDEKSRSSKAEVTTNPYHTFLQILTDSLFDEFNRKTNVLEDEARQYALLPHLQQMVIHYETIASEFNIQPIELASLLGSMGYVYSMRRDPGQAKPFYELALTIQEKHYGRDHVDVAATLTNLGNAYGDLGDMQRQKELLEQALPINEKYYGRDHLTTAITLGNLGNAYGNLGDLNRKKELLERALVIDEKHHGRDHTEVAITLTSLGNAYGDLGDVQRQKEFLERALTINEKHYGQDHPVTAITLMNLGEAFRVLGDAKKAKELLERALAIQEKHYGRDHSQTAMTLHNLGNTYGDLGDTKTKKELLERALAIYEKHYGREHPNTAKTLTNLSNVYGGLGDVNKKKEFLERALTIKEKHYGRDHPTTTMTLVSLSNAYGVIGDAQRQKELLERALTIQEKHYGRDHPHTAITLFNLSNTYRVLLGDLVKAKEMALRSYAIFKTHFGEQHPHTRLSKEVLEKLNNSLKPLTAAQSNPYSLFNTPTTTLPNSASRSAVATDTKDHKQSSNQSAAIVSATAASRSGCRIM